MQKQTANSAAIPGLGSTSTGLPVMAVNIDQAAQMIGVSYDTIRREIDRGRPGADAPLFVSPEGSAVDPAKLSCDFSRAMALAGVRKCCPQIDCVRRSWTIWMWKEEQ